MTTRPPSRTTFLTSGLEPFAVPLESTDACVICQDSLADIYQEPIVCAKTCGHVFHKPCLEVWIRAKRTCPVCCVELFCAISDLRSFVREEEEKEKGKGKDGIWVGRTWLVYGGARSVGEHEGEKIAADKDGHGEEKGGDDDHGDKEGADAAELADWEEGEPEG